MYFIWFYKKKVRTSIRFNRVHGKQIVEDMIKMMLNRMFFNVVQDENSISRRKNMQPNAKPVL